MSLLFMDGLDCYNSLADLAASGVWNYNQASAVNYASNGGRFGGVAFGLVNSNNSYCLTNYLPYALNKDYIVGFSYKSTGSLTSGTRVLAEIEDASGNTVLQVAETGGGGLAVLNISKANVGVSSPVSGVLPVNSWVRIEFKFNMGTSTTTGSIEVRVNGTTVITLTGQNFYRAGGGGSLWFYNSSPTGVVRWFDDLTINDTTGTENNDFLGDIRIDTLKPAADTAQADWSPDSGTSGYVRIDDPNGLADEDVSYIQSALVGDKSEFELANMIGISAAINAVQTRVRARKTDAGTRTYRAYMLSNGQEADGPAVAPTDGYSWAFNGLLETNPDGSVVWTDDAINNLKLGIELVS